MSRRILLADDSVTIQKVIELTFMDEDLEVTAVSNGDEALAKLPEIQPDLVIADVHMPGANGYEVCRRAKAARPQLPVLLLVGTFEPFDEAEARAAGSDAHLKKPFDSQELLSLVQQLLERAPAAAAAAPAPAASPAPAANPAPAASPAPADALSFEEMPTPDHAWQGFDLHAAPAPPAAPQAAPPAAPAAAPASPPAAIAMPQAPAPAPSPWTSPLTIPPLASAVEPAAAGRSAGFDWAETARFGRVDEPTFELEDTGEALGLDDSLLEDEPPPAAAGSPHGAAHELDEPFDLGSFESPSLAALATEADILPEPAAAAPRTAMQPPASLDERVGVPSGTAPLTAGLDDIEEHVHRADERHGEPISGGLGRPAPSEPEAWTPAVAAAPPPSVPLGAVALPAQLSEDEIDRIARRVVELLGDKAIRDVAWEVIPDMAEVVIKDRLRELESQVE